MEQKAPLITYSSQRQSTFWKLLRESGRDILTCRELATRLFLRNLRAQFRQSILGYGWLFLTPLTTTALWLVIRGSGAVQIEMPPGVSYAAYVLTASLLWQSFADALNAPLRHMMSNRNMLTKLNFQHEAPIVAGMFEAIFNSLIRLLLLVPIYLFVDISLDVTLLFFPLSYLAIILFGLMIGVWITPIGLLYTDIARGMNQILRLGMYLTPIVYPPAAEGFLRLIHEFNPLTYLILTPLDMLMGGVFDFAYTGPLIWMVPLSLGLLVVGWVVCRMAMPALIERMGM